MEKAAPCAESAIAETLAVAKYVRVTRRHHVIGRTTRWGATKVDGAEGADDDLDCCSVSSSSRRDERTSREDDNGRCLRVSVCM
jgi:hypothetical protein